MQIKKRQLALCLLLLVLLLAGCAGGDAAHTQADNPSRGQSVPQEVSIVVTTPSPSPEPTAVPTPEPTQVPTALIGGEQVPLTATEVTVQSIEDLDVLGQFYTLCSVDVSTLYLTVGQVRTLQTQFPEAQITCGVHLYDLDVGVETEELDLHGIEMTSPDDVMTAVACLPKLKKVDMRKCGLTNEQMETLVNAYPDVKFVWEVKMGTHTLRTDIVGFSTKNPSKYYNESSSPEYVEKVKKTKRLYTEDIQVLKYCTDLVALDLGHNYIDDISVLQYLPKLQILILADNKLTDISVFKELPELVYVEIFMNRIEDLSPLAGHDKLLDLNLCQNRVTDLSPLNELTQLERVWCSMNPTLTGAEARALREKLPNAVVNSTTDDDTGDGWREHERYFWMKEYFADNSPYNPS